ncbi:MAG: SusC/RagA family TonB-linked outer membrane protein [Prevotella sp.]|nr:SusC/RagA family TonB-linked outer membrane protein [Prevotella sp.]MCM1074142.1 SusC/RagA family TonB-linked outer membrane protein [Ruminococcus sp.]
MRKLFLTSMAVAAVVCAAQVQARTVTGLVVDAGTGETIIGATVMPIGGGQGVATDFDGNFTLNVPDNVKKARISAVGYKEQVVNLGPSIRVELAPTSSTLDEAIVIGYGTATKESLTGSVAVVGSKEIADRPVTNVATALEGNAPGVQVNSTTGAPGSEPSIMIRGVGSLTGGSSPQIVVDGVIYNGYMSDLNPADIESMTVLKDAASCAIYGVRGANGVILITTKKAKGIGKAEVTLQVREGMYTRGLPEYNRLNTNEWMETMFQAKANELMSTQSAKYPDRATANAYLKENFINGYLQGQNLYNAPANEVFDENGKLVATMYPGYTDLDWWDVVSRTGLRQEYNLNIAAAQEKYNVFASIGYLNEKGYLLKTDFERFAGRFNVNVMPTSYLRAGVNVNANYTTSEANQGTGTSTMINPFSTQFYSPIIPYYEHDAEGNIVYGEDGKPVWSRLPINNNRNVGWEMRLNQYEGTASLIDANAYATAVLPYGFELTFRGNMSRSFQEQYQYQNRVIGDAYPMGRLNTATGQERTHTFMQNLNWYHQYGNDEHMHSIDVVLGHENTNAYSSIQRVNMTNQIEDNYYAISNFTETNGTPSGSYGEGRTESYLGRARYNYNDKYFLEGSLRRDGSDRFHKDNRWGTFWSVGAGWIFSKEKFMENLHWVNYAKLRFSYGTVGNYLAAPAQSYNSLYGQFNYSSTAMMYRATLGNPNLKWEAQATLDIGIEGTLFNNRLNFSIGYFDKSSDDLIYAIATPWSLGTTMYEGATMTIPTNIGKIANRGWELSFNGIIMHTEDFNWTASLDMSFIKNKIIRLPVAGRDINNGEQRWSVGRSKYSWYLATFAGVDQMTGKSLYEFNKDEYFYYLNSQDDYTPDELEKEWQSQVSNAKNTLVEINGKTYTTDNSFATRRWHGTAMPTVYGSVGSQLSWKGINFGFLFTYSLGGKVFDSFYQSLMSVNGIGSAYHKDVLEAWAGIPEGMTEDSPNRIDPNGVPVNNGQDSQQNNAVSDRWLTNASWLVLKNLNISYDLPQNWVRAIQLQNVNVGFSVDNLFTVAGRKGLNPQQTWSGMQDSSTPGFMTNRVFSFQLTAKF